MPPGGWSKLRPLDSRHRQPIRIVLLYVTGLGANTAYLESIPGPIQKQPVSNTLLQTVIYKLSDTNLPYIGPILLTLNLYQGQYRNSQFVTRLLNNLTGRYDSIFASQGLRFGSPFSPHQGQYRNSQLVTLYYKLWYTSYRTQICHISNIEKMFSWSYMECSVWTRKICDEYNLTGRYDSIFASQGLRFGSPFSPPLADLEYILKFVRNATWWFIEVAPGYGYQYTYPIRRCFTRSTCYRRNVSKNATSRFGFNENIFPVDSPRVERRGTRIVTLG
jgi:hypothetical protein